MLLVQPGGDQQHSWLWQAGGVCGSLFTTDFRGTSAKIEKKKKIYYLQRPKLIFVFAVSR